MQTNQIYFSTHPCLIARNLRMAELRAEGKTFAEIGRMYGLSRQRVQQIIERDAKQNKQ
jgi:DNA-binding CsgD family transcriptional regulator